MKVNQKLLSLTNEFIEKFLLEAYNIECEELSSTDKREDFEGTKSFNFNYTLTEYLVENDFAKSHLGRQYEPLIGMGFVDNLAKAIFNKGIQGVVKNVEWVLENIDKNPSYSDYRIKLTNHIKDTFENENSINPNWNHKSTESLFITKTKNREVKFFEIDNSKSGRTNYCGIEYVDGKFEKLTLHESTEKNKYPILTISLELDGIDYDDIEEEVNKTGKLPRRCFKEKGEFSHYKYIADINSFFSNLSQIQYYIEEVIEEENKNEI